VELSSGLAKKRDITKLALKGMHKNSGKRAATHTEIGNTGADTNKKKQKRQIERERTKKKRNQQLLGTQTHPSIVDINPPRSSI